MGKVNLILIRIYPLIASLQLLINMDLCSMERLNRHNLLLPVSINIQHSNLTNGTAQHVFHLPLSASVRRRCDLNDSLITSEISAGMLCIPIIAVIAIQPVHQDLNLYTLVQILRKLTDIDASGNTPVLFVLLCSRYGGTDKIIHSVFMIDIKAVNIRQL